MRGRTRGGQKSERLRKRGTFVQKEPGVEGAQGTSKGLREKEKKSQRKKKKKNQNNLLQPLQGQKEKSERTCGNSSLAGYWGKQARDAKKK